MSPSVVPPATGGFPAAAAAAACGAVPGLTGSFPEAAMSRIDLKSTSPPASMFVTSCDIRAVLARSEAGSQGGVVRRHRRFATRALTSSRDIKCIAGSAADALGSWACDERNKVAAVVLAAATLRADVVAFER